MHHSPPLRVAGDKAQAKAEFPWRSSGHYPTQADRRALSDVGLSDGKENDMDLMALPWLLVVIGGPLLLGLALIWARAQASKRDRQIDPNTPADDPAKGMRTR